MRISTLKLTIAGSFFACMAIVCLLCCFENLAGALIALAVEGVFYIVMTKLFARCPHCGKPLGKNYLQIAFCPHCEMPLD